MIKDRKPYSLLLVEDNPGDVLLIEEYIKEYIHAPNITHADSFDQAKNHLCVQQQQQFDLVLLDLTLPNLQGEALIQEVMKCAGDIPVVVLTGFSDLDFSIRSLQLGVSDYLLKDDLTGFTLYKSIIHNIWRKNYIAVLERTEKRYNDLFHMSPQPMWVYDVNTLEFLDVNDAAMQHYGYSEEEFMQMTLKDLRPTGEMGTFMDQIKDIKETRRSYGYGVYTHCKKDGSLITVEIHGNEMEYDGRYARIVTTNDITDRIARTRAIEQQNQKLREIAWEQSHVVRAPLTRMMGLIDLLDGDTLKNNEEREFCMEEIKNSAREIDGIILNIVNKSEQIETPEEHES